MERLSSILEPFFFLIIFLAAVVGASIISVLIPTYVIFGIIMLLFAGFRGMRL